MGGAPGLIGSCMRSWCRWCIFWLDDEWWPLYLKYFNQKKINKKVSNTSGFQEARTWTRLFLGGYYSSTFDCCHRWRLKNCVTFPCLAVANCLLPKTLANYVDPTEIIRREIWYFSLQLLFNGHLCLLALTCWRTDLQVKIEANIDWSSPMEMLTVIPVTLVLGLATTLFVNNSKKSKWISK